MGQCNLLALNDTEFFITEWEGPPCHHSISRYDGAPQEEDLKYKDHARSHLRAGGAYCEH